MDDELTLDEFLVLLDNPVARFKEYWLKEQQILGENAFPPMLLEGDWFEQFIIFLMMEDQ